MTETMMHAVVCEELALDFSRVKLRELSVPQPGPGEVRIRVGAMGLDGGPYLLVDVGGGSVELTLVENGVATRVLACTRCRR